MSGRRAAQQKTDPVLVLPVLIRLNERPSYVDVIFSNYIYRATGQGAANRDAPHQVFVNYPPGCLLDLPE